MNTKTTHQIQVTVIPEYDQMNSYPSDNRFVFKYHIRIHNLSSQKMKLLKRKWLIYDVGFGYTEVVGDGVIGLLPELEPGEQFSYFSNVMLRSGVGNMQGVYLMQNENTQQKLEIEIPKFQLLSEVLCN